MRMFDLRNSWLDNDGKPLVGRISFCKLHTTDPENIYDSAGNPLANPLFTNTIGQAVSQVFLADRTDYTVRFDKYVGVSDMSEDQENWLFQYSADNLWNTYGISVDSTTFQLVNNIADLRQLDPDHVTERDGRHVVILGGYFVIGDKPQVTYIWNDSSTGNDNGGSVIKVEGISTGRWELVNTFDATGVDVRHFGVFGVPSRLDAQDTMSLSIGLANTYSSSIGLPLYFPAIDGITWYKINGINISGALFAQGTRIFGNTGTESAITITDPRTSLFVFENSDFGARFTIRGQEVHTYWGVNSQHIKFEPTYKLVIDSAINTIYKSWSGITVDVLEECSGCYFDGCLVNSIGKLGDRTRIKNGKVTESMFAAGTDFASLEVFADDTIDIDDFTSVANWLILVMQVFTGDTIDFHGRTVDSNCTIGIGTQLTYRNAVFSDFRVQQATVALVNCRGSVSTDSLESLGAVDCNLVITDATSGAIQSIQMLRSTVALHTSASATTVSLDNSTFAATNGMFIGNFGMVSSTLNSAIRCNVCDARNSAISGNITTSPTAFNFNGCTFNAKHIVTVTMANTYVIGQWVDNYGTVASPVEFNVVSGNLMPDDGSHSYVYTGNTGTFLPTEVEFEFSFDISHVENIRSGSYENVTSGDVGFYIKNDRDIIMAICLPTDTTVYPVFHIGPTAGYRLETTLKYEYQTFSTLTIRDAFVTEIDYVGDNPGPSALAGKYIHLPITGRLDNNSPTVIRAIYLVKARKTNGTLWTNFVG